MKVPERRDKPYLGPNARPIEILTMVIFFICFLAPVTTVSMQNFNGEPRTPIILLWWALVYMGWCILISRLDKTDWFKQSWLGRKR